MLFKYYFTKDGKSVNIYMKLGLFVLILILICPIVQSPIIKEKIPWIETEYYQKLPDNPMIIMFFLHHEDKVDIRLAYLASMVLYRNYEKIQQIKQKYVFYDSI